MNGMKKTFYAAVFYAVFGIIGGGLADSMARTATGDTQLRLIHGHVLVLGMIFMLVLLALEKVFELHKTKWFNLGFWHYNAGVVLTGIGMWIVGAGQMSGAVRPSVAGLITAGAGHVLLTVGLGMLLYAVFVRVKQQK